MEFFKIENLNQTRPYANIPRLARPPALPGTAKPTAATRRLGTDRYRSNGLPIPLLVKRSNITPLPVVSMEINVKGTSSLVCLSDRLLIGSTVLPL